jgi:hypothetical protein
LLFCLPVMAGSPVLIPASQWPQAVSGETVTSIPGLSVLLDELARQGEQARIVIRYPGGDAGTAWARDLHDWLVALGLRSARIQLEPASGIPDTLVLEVQTGALAP